jgi:hypothetical protein
MRAIAAAFFEKDCFRCGAIIFLGSLMGCGTTRMTDTQRTATEQLLISNAVDQTVSQLDFRFLAGKSVYLDPQYLDNVADRGYLVSSLRQQLLACGCILQEDRPKATYVVEPRSGSTGTDRHSLLVGVPQMTVPTFVPGQPSQIPEIPLAKKTDQQGVSKIAVFAYNRVTGERLWQSGTIEAISTARDTWVLGAGPFRKGTILQGTEFAGEQIPVPRLGEKQAQDAETRAPVVPVTMASIWPESPMARSALSSLIMPVPGRGLGPVIGVLVQSAQTSPTQAHDPARGAVSVATSAASVSKENSDLPRPTAGSAPGTGKPPAGTVNAGGQAETEPAIGFSTTWGLRRDPDVALPTWDEQPMKSKDASEKGSAVASAPGSTSRR